MEELTGFIQPIQAWNGIEDLGVQTVQKPGRENPSLFQDVFRNAIDRVRTAQEDVENKQYLLTTGQLDDAHSLPIAQAKATLSVEILVSLRNKAMEAYNEIMKISA